MTFKTLKWVVSGLVVWLVMSVGQSAWARAPIHNSYSFGLSGTTTLISHKQFETYTNMVALVATGDDIWITIDGTTTPVDGTHWLLEKDKEYVFKPSHAMYIIYLPDGDAVGKLNVIEFPTWREPY